MVKNSLFNLAAMLSGPLFNLLSIPIVTKALGPESFGLASMALSYISYFTILSSLGTSVYGAREIGRWRNDKHRLETTFNELLALTFIGSILSALFFVLVIINSDATVSLPVVAVGTAAIAVNFFNIEWLFQGFENYKVTAVRVLVSKASGLILLWMLVRDEDDVFEYVAVVTLTTVFPVIYTFCFYRRYLRLRINGLRLGRHFRSIVKFLSIRGFSGLYTTLDVAFVGFLAGATTAGVYALAIRVVRIIAVSASSLTAVSLPQTALLIELKDKGKYDRILVDVFVVSIFLGVLSYAMILVNAYWVILFLGGGEYLGALNALYVLALVVPVVIGSNYTGIQILYPNQKETVVAISLISGSIVCAVAMLILVDDQGVVGAAVAVLLAELCVLIVQAFHSRRYVMSAMKGCGKRIAIFVSVSMCWLSLVLTVIESLGQVSFILAVFLSFLFVALYVISLWTIREPLVVRLLNGRER